VKFGTEVHIVGSLLHAKFTYRRKGVGKEPPKYSKIGQI